MILLVFNGRSFGHHSTSPEDLPMARGIRAPQFRQDYAFKVRVTCYFRRVRTNSSRCGENSVVCDNADSAPPVAALHRKFLPKKSLEIKVALDAVLHASLSIGLVGRYHGPRSCGVDCVNAGTVSRAEFTRTTSSDGRTASRVRGYANCFRLLSSHCCCAARDCARDSRTIFENSGSQCNLGCSAVSWRMYF